MLWKTLWEKEKMLVTSIFSISHSVFYSIKERNHHFNNIYFVVCKIYAFNLDQAKILLFGKELTLSQTNPGFYVSAV